MPKNKYQQFSLPDWLHSCIECKIGRTPIWKFPTIPKLMEEIDFVPLSFENRYDFLELFEKDKDPWVDKRFKNPKEVYERTTRRKLQNTKRIKAKK